MHILHRIQSNLSALTAAVVIAALIVVVPSPLLAQQSAAAPKAAPQVEEEASSPAAKKPGDEGIKVHGHWIIDVKDKDGKLVEHRDFQNALQNANPLLLLLTGQAVPNSLTITVYDSNNAYYNIFPAITSTVHAFGGIQCGAPAPSCNGNMVTTLIGTASNNTPSFTGLKLSGQFTPTANVSLNAVTTFFTACLVSPLSQDISYATLTPASCAIASNNPPSASTTAYETSLTGTQLATPLSVAAGQSVAVSVTLSFS